jgi:hypothetical protein
VRLEGLGKFKKNHLIGYRTHDLLVCSIVLYILDVDEHWVFPNKCFATTDLKVIKPSVFHGTIKMGSVPLVYRI